LIADDGAALMFPQDSAGTFALRLQAADHRQNFQGFTLGKPA
jgi:hypothetical protein